MQPRPSQTFKKAERLCNVKLINKLFTSGSSFFEYPFKVIYVFVDDNDRFDGDYPAKVIFTVPKRKFKLAVHRNKVKRLMRESYRKCKHELYDHLNLKKHKIALAFIYTGNTIPNFHQLEKKINLSIQRLSQNIDKL
jgi:ribonuclease P protein component